MTNSKTRLSFNIIGLEEEPEERHNLMVKP